MSAEEFITFDNTISIEEIADNWEAELLRSSPTGIQIQMIKKMQTMHVILTSHLHALSYITLQHNTDTKLLPAVNKMIDDVEIKIIQNKLERQRQTSITDFFIMCMYQCLYMYMLIVLHARCLCRADILINTAKLPN